MHQLIVHSSLLDVPRGISFFFAHEFFDALPVNKFVRGAKGEEWHEILVDMDAEGEGLRGGIHQFSRIIPNSDSLSDS
jgi:SAM-dependent MidA family methyltransferase